MELGEQPTIVRTFEDAQRQLLQLYQALNQRLNGDNVILTHKETTGQTTDDHHAQGHTLASHSTKKHSELTNIGTSDHHVKAVDNELYGKLLTDVVANRPVAGTLDRWFYATDTQILYYDNGTAWVEAATSSTAIRTWTQNSVLNDFSRWTLTDTALNGSNEIELVAI